MAVFAGDSPWPMILKDVNRTRRQPLVAVVAFIGVDAPEILPLRRGDALVCDASDFRIRDASTSAAALETYRKRGVHIYSVPALHAKVIASPRIAWVGSANASTSSTNLYEASVRLSGTDVDPVYKWALSKCTPDANLSREDIQALIDIKVTRRGAGPVRRVEVLHVPDEVRQLVLLWMDSEATATVRRRAARDLPRIKRECGASSADDISWFQWGPGDDTFKDGTWVVRTYDGGMTGPLAKVVRISQVGRSSIVWLQTARSRRDPYTHLFAGQIADWATYEEVGILILKRPREIQAVLDAFRPLKVVAERKAAAQHRA